jgi:hypothetical protein
MLLTCIVTGLGAWTTIGVVVGAVVGRVVAARDAQAPSRI